jgi:hypothetical protein
VSDRTQLKIGDRIRVFSVPTLDQQQREREIRDGADCPGYTANTIERIILEHPYVTITKIDDYGTPWFEVTLRENGQKVYHSIAILDDDSWLLLDRKDSEPPLQFSIRELMIAQAVVLLACGLLAMFHIYALLGIFIFSAACFIRTLMRPEHRKLRFITDLLFGVVLPILCFLFDPGLFNEQVQSLVQAAALPAVLIQVSALAIWLFAGRWLGRWNIFLCGILSAGGIMAVVIGFALIPLSLIGITIYGIGLLGLTPFFTCAVFVRNAKLAYKCGCNGEKKVNLALKVLLFLFGFALAVAIPFLVAPYVSGPIAKFIKYFLSHLYEQSPRFPLQFP